MQEMPRLNLTGWSAGRPVTAGREPIPRADVRRIQLQRAIVVLQRLLGLPAVRERRANTVVQKPILQPSNQHPNAYLAHEIRDAPPGVSPARY